MKIMPGDRIERMFSRSRWQSQPLISRRFLVWSLKWRSQSWVVVAGFVHLSRFRSLSVIDRIDFLLCVGFYFLSIESFATKDAAQMSSSSIKESFDGTISGKFLSQEESYEWERSTVRSMRNIVRFGFISACKTNVLWFSVGTKYQTVSTLSSCRLSLRFGIMMFIIRIRRTVLCMLHGLRVNVHTVDHHDIVVSLRRVSSRLKREPWIQVTRAIPSELPETIRA